MRPEFCEHCDSFVLQHGGTVVDSFPSSDGQFAFSVELDGFVRLSAKEASVYAGPRFRRHACVVRREKLVSSSWHVEPATVEMLRRLSKRTRITQSFYVRAAINIILRINGLSVQDLETKGEDS